MGEDEVKKLPESLGEEESPSKVNPSALSDPLPGSDGQEVGRGQSCPTPAAYREAWQP